MNNASAYDQLDRAIDALVTNPELAPARVDPSICELAEIAAELRNMPRPGFKAQLKADLMERAGRAAGRVLEMPPAQVLPTLFSAGDGGYPVHRTNFAASFLLHAAAMVLLATSGVWMVQHREEIRHQFIPIVTSEAAYALPPAHDEAQGGGGGGTKDKIAASKGSAPRFDREQLTPPGVVLQSDKPKLPAEPTLIGPPALVLPRTAQTGDPYASILTLPPIPSNGAGSAGGIGSGTGGGVGSGTGPGLGPGSGGGYGGGVYRVGGGVSSPRAIYDPEPDYSEEARKAKYQGTVMLWAIIGADGIPRDVRVARTLGMGLDQKAVEAVRKWRFEPARKDGHPVAVEINIEVNFRLY